MWKNFGLDGFIVREAEGVTGVEPEAPKTPVPVPAPQPTWQEKRIAELTAKLHAEKAKNAAAQAQAEPPAASQPDVLAMARQIAEANAFDQACNEVAAAGREAFGVAEFNSRVSDLSSLIDRSDQAEASRYNSFLQIAIDTGEGPKIIHALGGDKNEAARILALSPGKMAVALAKLATKVEKTEAEPEAKSAVTSGPLGEVSKAPKPITPIGARSAANSQVLPDDPDRGPGLDKATWFAKREAQIAEVRKAGRRMQ